MIYSDTGTTTTTDCRKSFGKIPSTLQFCIITLSAPFGLCTSHFPISNCLHKFTVFIRTILHAGLVQFNGPSFCLILPTAAGSFWLWTGALLYCCTVYISGSRDWGIKSTEELKLDWIRNCRLNWPV